MVIVETTEPEARISRVSVAEELLVAEEDRVSVCDEEELPDVAEELSLELEEEGEEAAPVYPASVLLALAAVPSTENWLLCA